MSLGSLPNRILHKIRLHTKLGAWGASLWHRYMLPLPVSKKFYGLKICLNLRDGLLWLVSNPSDLEQAERFSGMLAGVKGSVWDVGCNVGVFSLMAASKGFKVVAFDISPVAINLVKKSAKANCLELETVCQAFAAEKYVYSPPEDAHTENAPQKIENKSQVTSMTFSEAEQQFGRPAFIKVDIEHHEVALLKSEEFKNWIKTNAISLLVELHDAAYSNLVWQDIEHCMFSSNHVLFFPTPEHKEFLHRVATNL